MNAKTKKYLTIGVLAAIGIVLAKKVMGNSSQSVSQGNQSQGGSGGGLLENFTNAVGDLYSGITDLFSPGGSGGSSSGQSPFQINNSGGNHGTVTSSPVNYNQIHVDTPDIPIDTILKALKKKFKTDKEAMIEHVSQGFVHLPMMPGVTLSEAQVNELIVAISAM